MHRVLFLLLALILFLKREAAAQRLPFTVYTTAQGLANNRCQTVKQDGLGYIWIGTDHGISRFDGRTFKNFPSPLDPFRPANNAALKKDGALYFIVSGNGVARCKGDSVSFLLPKNGRVGFSLSIAPAQDGGFLFTEDGAGLMHLHPDGTLTNVTPRFAGWKPRLLDLFLDSRGTLWCTAADGVIYFPGADLRRPVRYHPLDGLYASAIRESPQGELYMGGEDGLWKLPRISRAEDSSLPAVQLLDSLYQLPGIAFEAEGALWAGSISHGVLHYTGSRVPESYSLAAGLPAVAVWDLFCDREGNFWAPTENGLARLSARELSLYDYSGIPWSAMKSGLVWNDSLLLYSNGMSIYQLSGREPRPLPGYHGVAGYVAERLLRTPNGKLWVTMADEQGGGVFRNTTYTADITPTTLRNIRPLSTLPGGPDEVSMDKGWAAFGNALWTLTDRGLLRYENGLFSPDSVRGWDGAMAQPTALCTDPDGSVWMIDRGVSVIKCRVENGPDGARLKVARHFKPKTLHHRRYTLLFVDSRRQLWLGGREGLTICSPLPGHGGYAVAVFGEAEGSTSSKWITSIAEDHRGDVWVGTTAGLDKAAKRDGMLRIEKGQYRSELCGDYIFFVRRWGKHIVVGSTSCVAVINLSATSVQELPPLVYLSGLRVMGQPRDSLLNTSRPVRLQPGEASLAFSFVGLSYRDEKGVRYRYKLDGLEEFWSQPTSEASITYSRIPPGTYRFLVEAQSAGGQWSAQPAAFAFMVLQPVYTRWWFVLLCVGATAGILYGIYRYRLAQVMAIQRIRAKISKDLHDDIGATVSSIGILASIAGKNELKEEKRHQYLDTISDQSKYVAETLSDIVWAINPSNDSLEKLFARVVRYATELFEARGIEYTVDVPPDALRGLSLPMDARQNLYLLIKEAVNNLLKYSGAAQASILVKREAGHLTVSVADDGKGFDPETVMGNGLPNMRKRAQALHAALRILSKQGGGGTRVELDIPLKAGARMM